MGVKKSQSGLGLGGQQPGLMTGAGSTFVSKTYGTSEFFQWEHAEVLEVELNPEKPENVGRVRFRTFNDSGKDSQTLSWAVPLIPYVRAYPILHEIVAITEFNGRHYWLSPLNTLNLLNNNIQANLTERIAEDTGPGSAEEYGDSQSYGIPHSSTEDAGSTGETFKNQRLKIGILSPEEGDVILEGRFNNSIRFGNNPESNLPNIKISVRNLLEEFQIDREDLNEDSCIFITTDEILTFDPVGIPISEENSPPFEYSGKQIMITSDRLIFNAKLNEILIFSNKSISLASNGNFSVDTDTQAIIKAKKEIKLQTSDNFIVDTDKQMLVKAKDEMKLEAMKVMIGNWNADEPIVLGNKWKDMMITLINVVLEHVHPTGTGPTGPLMPPQLSNLTNLKTSVTNKDQLSDDNFSTKTNK